MINHDHRGVGALITNFDRSDFFIQIKDETYPYEKWRGANSLWGGALEEDDPSELDGLFRELEEEFNWKPDAIPTFMGTFSVASDHIFPISLFEIVLDQNQLQDLAATSKVAEGSGLLIPKNELFINNWVWDLDGIVRIYFELLK